MRIDTWFGDTEVGRLATGNVDASKAPTYKDVRLKRTPNGAPVMNPPKPIEAQWVIGFDLDAKPVATLRCTCGAVTPFELSGNGKAPVARCCKNAPAYPQDRKHTAHLLATGFEGDGRGNVVVSGIPPEPGTVVDGVNAKPQTETTMGDMAQFVERLVKADMASAKKTGEAIEAAIKKQVRQQ